MLKGKWFIKVFLLGADMEVSYSALSWNTVTLPCSGYRAYSETQGQSVGSRERPGRKFSSMGERAPGYTDSHRAISKNSNRCRLLIEHKKCFVLLCPIGQQFLLISFRDFAHQGYYLDHSLSGSSTKELHAVRKLAVWFKISIWFQNTVCRKTKDAFPKIQASACNRYSGLHLSRLA